ncbi:MAG: aromatic amino acid transport family protein [Patescibacteria group bacterium]|nr:aromatic amino acid transport family protein [Patescibacteria group bacterium]
MKQKSVTLIIAISLLGTIVGAGIFGLPAVFSQIGILGGTILFAAVLFVVVVLNHLYIDIIYSVRGSHRLPGYMDKILGRKAYWVAIAGMIGKTSGTLLAYVILGGTFLQMLAQGLGNNYPIWMWTILFWGVGSLIVFYGIKVVSEIEGELTWLLIGFMLFTAVILFPFINWNAFTLIHIDGFVGSIGIIFFSTTAMTVLPDLKDIAKRRQNDFRLGTTYAVLGAGLLSWMFGVVIASVYPNVSSVADIQNAFPKIFWWLIPLVGLLAVSTSFLTFTQALKNLLHIDLKIKRTPAWIISVVTPILLFAVVSQNFLQTIGFVGGVLTTLNGFMICLAAYKVLNKPQKVKNWIDHVLHREPKPGERSYWAWRYIPIPIALALSLVIIEHLITIF